VTDQTDDLLKALVNVMGRVAIPPDKLRPMIAPGARAQKQEKAYNLCDGTRQQGEIAKKLNLDRGNFSRTVKRWEELGLLFRVGPNGNLLHLYPLGGNVSEQ
jgi:hypothetical protein